MSRNTRFIKRLSCLSDLFALPLMQSSFYQTLLLLLSMLHIWFEIGGDERKSTHPNRECPALDLPIVLLANPAVDVGAEVPGEKGGMSIR